MKSRIFLTLFALPFAAVGVWMAWSISSSLADAWQMRDWVPVEARLQDAGYETRTGDDSDTYKAYAEYVYVFRGQQYTGHRVGIAGGADNVGDYQREIGRNLAAALAAGKPILVYVDANEPADAIIDRGLRWGLLGFRLVFVIVFGGFGIGMLYAAWRAPSQGAGTNAAPAEQPWLANKDWQSATVASSSRNAMWGAWAVAIFWNAISSVVPFFAWHEIVDNGRWIALLALLFPLVGVGLIVWAVRRSLEWRRFGAAPVTLDPFPGSIGGHVGGTVELNLPFDAAQRFRVTLTNIHSYRSGDSRSENAAWQDSTVAHAEPRGRGTRLIFRFDVPAGLHAADADRGGDYYLWRLSLHADLPGTDLDRAYDLPVYATARQSQHLSPRDIAAARSDQASAVAAAVRERVRLRYTAMGKRMFFPMGRHLGNCLGGLLVGAVFTAVGWFLVVQEHQKLFGSVFGGLGALIAVLSFYMVANSLEVTADSSTIRSTRRLLGIPVGTRHVYTGDITELAKSSRFRTQSGSEHVVFYAVNAVTRDGDKIVLGEGFRGASEANAAIELMQREFGIRASGQTAGNTAGAATRMNIARINT